MTFAELTKGCTNEEREALAWHLAMIRARKTVEALLRHDRPPGDGDARREGQHSNQEIQDVPS